MPEKKRRRRKSKSKLNAIHIVEMIAGFTEIIILLKQILKDKKDNRDQDDLDGTS